MGSNGLVFLNTLNLAYSKKTELLKSFDDSDLLINVSHKELSKFGVLNQKDIDKFLSCRDSRLFEREISQARDNGIQIVDLHDQRYPEILREIFDPPLVLYVKGNVDVLSKMSIAVVGTRIPTPYGSSVAENLSSDLSSMGINVVSGLARGIDTCAHRGALSNGITTAVLGSGLLNVYPRENKRLGLEIANCGAVISEYILNMPPLRENFPKRNRIVSGLSKGVVIVEAAKRSGALITARLACEQNREVFAVPGEITSPVSVGPNYLIKEGAKLVENIKDILDEFSISSFVPDKDLAPDLKFPENVIFDIVDFKGKFFDEILAQSQLARQDAFKGLLSLVFKGFVKELKPSFYAKV